MKKHILLLSFIIPIIFAVSCNEHSGVIPTFNYTTDYPVKEFPSLTTVPTEAPDDESLCFLVFGIKQHVGYMCTLRVVYILMHW
ncbi:MAG: hypothetical protein RR880_05030, partial [Bacteroidales bacterium]